VVVWDLTGDRQWERPFGSKLKPFGRHPLVVSPDGSSFVVIDVRGFAEFFDGRTLRPIGRIRPARGRVHAAEIAPGGDVVAITTYDGVDGMVEFWDVRTRRRLGRPQVGHAAPAEAVSWSADGRWLATGDVGGLMRIWDARRATPRATALEAVADLSLSPDGKLVAVTLLLDNFGGGLQLRSVPGLELVRTVAVPSGTAGRFSPDGRTFSTGIGTDGSGSSTPAPGSRAASP
jgi:WD40 repeat protein